MSERNLLGNEGASSSNAPNLLHGRYEVQKKLGEGGFAETYLAFDHDSNRSCVLKELSWKKVDDWKIIELFEREAKVLSNLDHPRIPAFLNFFTVHGKDETKIYLVQEYIEGRNLAEWIKSGKHFTEKEIIEIGMKLTEILEYLHNLSPPIIHRDIKPSNIILNEEGEVYLVDFGAVRDKVLQSQMTQAAGYTVIGTYGYMPFEQFQGQAMPATDIYSLGGTFVYLLSHKEPHEMTSASGRLEFWHHARVSKGLEQVLRKMTEPQAEDRYQSAGELRKDLQAILAGEFPLITTEKTFLAKRRFLVAILAAVLAAGVFTFFQFRIEEKSKSLVETTPRQTYTPPAGSGRPVSGRILFDGRPITEFTNYEPRFWFRNEATGQVQSADVVYHDGSFVIRGVPPGEYGMSVRFDTNMSNPPIYPGDFEAWTHFQVGKDTSSGMVVEMQKIIHLLKPQDNGSAMDRWSAKCSDRISLPTTLEFDWESLGRNVFYDYQISRVKCPFTAVNSVTSGTTKETRISVQLPPSQEDEYYAFELDARKEGRKVGLLITHGANGYGWDYRFRIPK